MSPSVGTSSGFLPHIPPAGRIDHVPAACERVSACRDACEPLRGADCFERGPVPFADFLYHENRRLELERPRALAFPDAGSDTDRAASQGTPVEPEPTRGLNPTDPPEVAIQSGDPKAVRQGAIVMGFSRPTLVAKFIDLYA